MAIPALSGAAVRTASPGPAGFEQPQPFLYLSAYFDTHRQEYHLHLLWVSQRGDWDGWLHFFLSGISIQSLDAVKRIARLQDLRSAYQRRLHPLRATGRLPQTLDVLFAGPILSVRQVSNRRAVRASWSCPLRIQPLVVWVCALCADRP